MFYKEFGFGPARFAWGWQGEKPLPWMTEEDAPHSPGHGPWGRRPWGPRPRGPWGQRPWGPSPEWGVGPFAWRFGAHHRHGPFGPGGPGGPRHRMVERGGMKYALLELLQERPKHGYEMIKELEERFGGFYAPSPGSVYPTLQLLEDQGYVTSSVEEGKKVYTITDTGRAFLAERPAPEEGFPRGPFGPRWFGAPWMTEPEMRAMAKEVMEVTRLFGQAVRATGGNPEALARLRTIVERTRRELLDALSGQPQQPTAQA